MLKQRVLTALILLPLMLGMLFSASSGLWAVFSGLIALLALWEFSRLARIKPDERAPYLIGTAIFMFFAASGGWKLSPSAWFGVLLLWFVLVPVWLVKRWKLHGNWRSYTLGWSLMLPFWFGLLELRPYPETAESLLAVMGLVWVADIFAYFFGKAFGKHKIAPSVSPGKSWEGAIGGALCVLIYMTIVRSMGWLSFDASWFAVMLLSLLLTVVSIGGDLFESMLKRAVGMKDSSHLLPGHGGVFDRIDSLIAVVSVYAAMMAIFG
ncbi:phosphatidate cytidylyltransferase [Neisseria weaveri]|uniref:Phosphatidate cytidylyltransferase n=1 Tax=Neisseria weaveri TaxID=28091 RepID=A0A3S4Z3U0_9NEIS|nr:phosphatidate cytidylyltransferase [Neisseria weaveri]EGV35712.1 hypothetical protein l13_14040 [Neisseria weaveri ATCC 51223]EGV38238.1 hypothetical protein l11_05620 [Neisseria weaveri LMG 5135]VEJ50876.1 phosphatidate cytidylyltransferase [Neisseria weaveri]